MSSATTIDVYPVREERLSAKEFLALVARNPDLIERSRIIPPSLGSKGFGQFHVTYKRPQYRPLHAFRPVAR